MGMEEKQIEKITERWIDMHEKLNSSEYLNIILWKGVGVKEVSL